MISRISTLCFVTLTSAALLAACNRTPADESEDTESVAQPLKLANYGTYNLHLQDVIRFDPIQPGADADSGRALFGIAADLETADDTDALFEGASDAFGGVVTSNGRSCFSCHRGASKGFGLPAPPLSATIDITDPLFTGIDADAQGDPDAFDNLNERGLFKYRPNRFNLTRPATDPFRRVFFWRKSPRLMNIGLAHGFLNDARGRTMFEADRGAVFSHTQSSDGRFDDLFTLQNSNDMEAFQFGLFTQPELAALRDPQHPLHEALKDDPFYTVPITTQAQKRGKNVFIKSCMVCHNMPNVFNNRSHILGVGNGERGPNNPAMAPSVARTFNVGVSERNFHNLRFTEDLGNGQFAPIVIPLVKLDGTVVNLPVSFDIGLAATTARYEDIGRFKVPQLRNLAQNGPYFHDNSAATIEEVVDFFNSPAYNNSADGHLYPIHMSPAQRADLIAFLQIL